MAKLHLFAIWYENLPFYFIDLNFWLQKFITQKKCHVKIFLMIEKMSIWLSLCNEGLACEKERLRLSKFG